MRTGAAIVLCTYNEQAERDQNKKEGTELLIYVSSVITKGKLRIMQTDH
jgi:hypothetical protein